MQGVSIDIDIGDWKAGLPIGHPTRDSGAESQSKVRRFDHLRLPRHNAYALLDVSLAVHLNFHDTNGEAFKNVLSIGICPVPGEIPLPQWAGRDFYVGDRQAGFIIDYSARYAGTALQAKVYAFDGRPAAYNDRVRVAPT